MIATFTDYNAKVDKWVTIREVHASMQAAKVRAKVKGWVLLGTSRPKKGIIGPSKGLTPTHIKGVSNG